MRAEYKRDMNHNYLILHGDKEIDTASYQVRMLVGNVIPSLLKCRVQGIDGTFMVYYDVTSRQPLASLYEQKKFKMEDLRLIFGGFVQVMEEMSEYLLNPGELIIRPEYMYLDVEKKEMFFCYLPGFQQDVREQFQALTEYVLPKLDHEDGKAVMLGYGVYRRALEDSFHLEHMKEELYHVQDTSEEIREPFTRRQMMGHQSETEAEERAIRQGWKEEGQTAADKSAVLWQKDNTETGNDYFRREDISTKKNRREEAGNKYISKRGNPIPADGSETKLEIWKKVLWSAVGTMILMGVILAKLLGYLPWIQMESILGFFLVCMGAGMLGYKIYSRKRKGRETQSPVPNEKRPICKNHLEDRKEDVSRGYLYRRDFDLEEEGQEISTAIPQGRRDEVYGEQEDPPESCGETVILSENTEAGPASLVSREPGELATIFLKEDLTVIGKLETAADAVIHLPTVSRVHAKIRKRDGKYYLSDLNSRNGTSVNGRILKGEEECQLQDQDEVDFAQARYVFLE